ncbi:hypothetical protein MKW92_011776 [Papaver armeniacum]|nr:hypothetical protein MKW92_011776 [Papaver armeniacum]
MPGAVSNGGGQYADPEITVIDKETESHHTFEVQFNTDVIRTIVTDRTSIVNQWIADVYEGFPDKLKDGNNLIVGLDIEWVRLRETDQRNKIAVLQLCLENQCLIFQFFGRDKDMPQNLINFLNDDRIMFVGAGIDQDARKLWVDWGLNVARSEELAGLAEYTLGRTDIYRAGLRSLMRIVLRKELPKPRGILLSRWDIGDEGVLRDEQVRYACLDAYASYKIGMELMSRLEMANKVGPKEDFKRPPQQTNQGQAPKAPNQGQDARASNQDQGARAPNQVQGTKAPSQGQGARAPNQVQGTKAPSQGQDAKPRYYESRIKKPTLLDFIV